MDAMGQITTFAFDQEKHYPSHMTNSPVNTRLMNKAVDYLGRYATSQHRLREVLCRFALRKLDKHDPDEIAAAIGATVTRCQTLGYLDDGVFAQSQARSQRRLGRSKLSIRQRLRQHKLHDTVIDAALDAADKHVTNGELLSACKFARRRRLGPFDRWQYDDAKSHQVVVQRQKRQLGSLARAGFTMEISRTVIELEDKDAAEMLIEQLEQGEDPTI
jgi:SOS response regulatory protein OraA/RecX